MPDPNWDSPDVIGKNYVWNEALGKWVPQALSTGTGSDVNVTNDPLNVNVTNAALVVHNYVWDTGTLDWVEQEQGAAGGGDASAANQTTEIGHLAAIETAVEALEPNPLTDAELRATPVPVSVSGVATATKQDAQTAHLATLAGAVGGTEVQVDVVTLPALPAGTNNIGDVDVLSLPALPAGNNNIGDVDIASSVLPTGASTLAEQQAQSTLVGAVNESAPGTDTASSGLNGRLQRVAQRLTSLIALLPAALVSGRLDVNLGAAPATVTVAALPSGTNNIGDVDVLTVPADPFGATADAAVSAGATGSISAKLRSISRDLVANIVLAAGTATIGGAIPRPTTSGGLDVFRTLDADETEEDVKTSAGQLYGYYFSNASTSPRFLKFYNATAANVTVGSTTPFLTLGLPASSAGHVEFAHGIAFSTAISVAATTAVADADTGAPSANDVVVNVLYK